MCNCEIVISYSESQPVLDVAAIRDICTIGVYPGILAFHSVFGATPNRSL